MTVFALGLSWVFTRLGLPLRSPGAVMDVGYMAMQGSAFPALGDRRRAPPGRR